MAEVKESSILIQDVETKNIMTKSTLPVGGYSVNPYVGCTHGCKYCYASFMKRFTGHTEPWGTFLDVKYWPAIKNPRKYAGQRVVIGSVTDGYLPQEAQFQNTRKLLEQLRGSEAEILICTKSDLVIRDIDLLKELGKVTVSWSINTLDEDFKNDMDNAVSIKRNGWRKKTAVPSWTTSCPTDEQSLGTRSLWITFTMRKCVARKTPGSELKKYDLRVL